MLIQASTDEFCRKYIDSRNLLYAYRQAFRVGVMPAQEVFDRATALLRDPDIATRLEELRCEASMILHNGVRELMQDWYDIASADPSDIVAYAIDSCRMCHGEGHNYQWASEMEFAVACEKAIAAKQLPPDCPGGFGFDPHRSPMPGCPSCHGDGVPIVRGRDSRELVGPARKLYKGAKQRADGSIEILLHDQQAARESLARALGLFKDGLPPAPMKETERVAAEVTPAEAARAYLRLVSG